MIIELLIGFAIVLVALLAVFGLFPTAERSAVLADKSTHAYNFASQVLQNTLAKHYSTLTVGVVEDVEPMAHTLRKGIEAETEFHFRVEITKPYPSKEILNVVVDVTWTEGSGDELRPSAIRLEGEKSRLW